MLFVTQMFRPIINQCRHQKNILAQDGQHVIGARMRIGLILFNTEPDQTPEKNRAPVFFDHAHQPVWAAP
jgi:hypothetical protein